MQTHQDPTTDDAVLTLRAEAAKLITPRPADDTPQPND
jgi:hypothetical protein